MFITHVMRFPQAGAGFNFGIARLRRQVDAAARPVRR